MKKLLSVLLLVFSVASLAAQSPPLKLAKIFGDNGVLQREKEVPVWGWATPGAEVTVRFKDQEATAKAGESGRWQVMLKPMKADAAGADLTAACGAERVAAKGVLVGEVWLCGGRSQWGITIGKMVEQMKAADPEIENQVAAMASPQLRMIKVDTRKPASEPQQDFDSKGWVVATDSSIRGYPAISVVFGSDLQKALGVPVGVITNNWGGSSAPLWIRNEAFEAFSKGKSGASASDGEYEKASAEYHKKGAGDYADNKKPGILWNSHVAPLVPYAIRGLVWYLDDIDGPKAEVLVKDWREQWGSDFVVLLNQVHPADSSGQAQSDPDPKKSKSKAPETREGLMDLEKKLPSVWTSCNADLGDENDKKNIHPANKKPVGERLALLARQKVYGQNIAGHSPVFKEMKVSGDRAVITFDSVGGGLACKGDSLGGFAISGDGNAWAWAEVSITGPDQITLSAPGISSPKAVCYAWAPYPIMSLYTKEGLPAAPFRTDR